MKKGGHGVRRSQFDYRSYRGRKSAGDWLKWIALVLAILVVLAVGVLLWGQQYISYTDQGLRVDLPFLHSQPKQPDLGEDSTGRQDPGTDTSDQQTPDQPEQPPEQTAARGLSVSLSALLDGSAAQLAQQQGADSVVVEMKNDQGQLGWHSQQELAAALQPEAQDEQVNEKLKVWNQGDIYTVARISCFRDETVGGQMAYTLQTTSGYRWKDGEGMHWSDPANQQVQDYLTGLIRELAELGFDEILLDHCGYPSQTDGLLSNIAYADQQAAAVADHFLTEAARALEPYGTVLSLSVRGEQVGGQDGSSGLTAQNINRHAQRVWMEGEEQTLVSLLSGAGIDKAESRLVLWSEAFVPDSPVARAIPLT